MGYRKDEEEYGKKRKVLFIYTSFDEAVSKSERRPKASYFESKVIATKGSGEKLHTRNENLSDLYSSPNIVRVIKSRIIRWAGKVACMGEKRVYTGFWWRNMRKRDHLVDPGVEGTIILRWIFRK